jgi:hypothetical protein
MHREPATLLDVMASIRRAKFFILCGVISGLALAVAFLTFAMPSYRAQMIVGPAAPISNDENAGAAAKLHASELSDANAMNFTRFEVTMTGPTVAGALLKDEKIFEGLMADRPYGLLEPESEWTPQELSDYIKSHVRIQSVGTSPLRRLVYYHPSPGFAAYFLTQLHNAADGMIRRAIRSEAEQRISYLQKTAQAAGNPEHRRSITDLLLEQERLLMLASVDQAYAATVIEPASSSYKPEWPDRFLILAAFMFSGVLAGFVVYGFRVS